MRTIVSPAQFDWKDPLGSSNLYTEEELAIAETAESYCQERMLPRVLGVREAKIALLDRRTDLLTDEQRRTATRTTIARF